MPRGDADSDMPTSPDTVAGPRGAASDRPSGLESTIAPSGLEPTIAPSGLEPTIAPSEARAMRAASSGLESTVSPPVRDTPPTLRPPYRAPVSEQGEPIKKPSLETVAPTLAADAHDLPELPVIDAGMYTVGAEIGRGGMGRVIVARDRKLRRDVVIKVLHRGASTARFQREALITARLQHPSIVRVYDAGWLDGAQPFYSMEIVRGESLDRVVGAAEDSKSRIALLPHVIAVAGSDRVRA